MSEYKLGRYILIIWRHGTLYELKLWSRDTKGYNQLNWSCKPCARSVAFEQLRHAIEYMKARQQ